MDYTDGNINTLQKKAVIAPAASFVMGPWNLKREDRIPPVPERLDERYSLERRMTRMEENFIKLQDVLISNNEQISLLRHDLSLLDDNVTMLCSKLCRLMYYINELKHENGMLFSTPVGSPRTLTLDPKEELVFMSEENLHRLKINDDEVDMMDCKPITPDEENRGCSDCDYMRDWQ